MGGALGTSAVGLPAATGGAVGAGAGVSAAAAAGDAGAALGFAAGVGGVVVVEPVPLRSSCRLEANLAPRLGCGKGDVVEHVVAVAGSDNQAQR